MEKGNSKLKVVYRKVADLIPYGRNSRTHSDTQINQVIASIKEFGWTNPILLDGKGGIIAGHARLEAAKRMGLAEVPTIELSGLSEAQKRAYIIADNKLALNAGWDEELLRLELVDLKELDFNLDLTGFDELELTGLLNPGTVQGNTDPDEVPEAPKIPVSVPGDLWVMGGHRLICGDSTNPQHVERVMGGVSPMLMVTDPPYGVEYDPDWRNRADRANGKPYGARATGRVQNDSNADWSGAWALFQGQIIYCWHAGKFASVVQKSLESAGFEIVSQIIWGKDRFVISRGDYHWQHEPCWYAVRKGNKHNWNGDRSQTTLWKIGHQKSETGHGTQKPVECMRRPIVNHTNPGQCVYEPFSGSGTTIIAAETIGRICLAIEIDSTYVDVAVERWQNFASKKAVLEGDGRTFDEIKAERISG